MRFLYRVISIGVWAALLASCAASGGYVSVPGVRSCDRNGDYEQRVACDR